MAELDDLLRELVRPEAVAAPAAQWRRASVTAARTTPAAEVQTDLTGDAWIRYPQWYAPAVGDVVELLVQGTDAIVVTVLA